MLATGLIRDSSHIAEMLNELIQYCEDGSRGYADAAEAASSSQLKNFFQKQEQERAKLSLELQNLVETYGGNPEDSGSIQGALHRTWLITRDKLTGTDDEALLDECLRGESAVLEKYDEALEADLPFDIHSVVKRQKLTIEEAKAFLDLRKGKAEE